MACLLNLIHVYGLLIWYALSTPTCYVMSVVLVYIQMISSSLEAADLVI